MELLIEGGAPLVGETRVPADKSILHRALIFAAMAEGRSIIAAHAPGQDNRSTASALMALGANVETTDTGFVVEGHGVAGLQGPQAPIDCGNSGTTIRLLAGLLAGAGIEARLVGDESLSRRPMARVCDPLRKLGAAIAGESHKKSERPPLSSGSGRFSGGEVRTPVASAQVKSALLLAGVASGAAVEVTEPHPSRDHSERLLAAMGAQIAVETTPAGHRVALGKGARLRALEIAVPADPSSAAFLVAAATLVPGSQLVLRDVGLNPTRTGAFDILTQLGGAMTISERREIGGEPRGTLRVEKGDLAAGEEPVVVEQPLLPRLIDELPLLAVVASQAHGTLVIRDAAELRVKESDRIAETVRLLAAFGISAREQQDGLVIKGPQTPTAATLDVGGDHRIALCAAVLALLTAGQTVLRNFDIAAVSFSGFAETLETLGAKLRST